MPTSAKEETDFSIVAARRTAGRLARGVSNPPATGDDLEPDEDVRPLSLLVTISNHLQQRTRPSRRGGYSGRARVVPEVSAR